MQRTLSAAAIAGTRRSPAKSSPGIVKSGLSVLMLRNALGILIEPTEAVPTQRLNRRRPAAGEARPALPPLDAGARTAVPPCPSRREPSPASARRLERCDQAR